MAVVRGVVKLEKGSNPLFFNLFKVKSLAIHERTHSHKPLMYYLMIFVHFNLCFQHVRTRDACRESISKRNSQLRKQLSQQETQPLRQEDVPAKVMGKWLSAGCSCGRWFSFNTQWFSRFGLPVGLVVPFPDACVAAWPWLVGIAGSFIFSSSSSSSPTIFPISSLILRVPRTSLSVDLL